MNVFTHIIMLFNQHRMPYVSVTVCTGNQLQDYADGLEGRLADAEVEEESTKSELLELRGLFKSLEEGQEEAMREFSRKQEASMLKMVEYETKIKDMDRIISENKSEKDSYLMKYSGMDESVLQRISDAAKSEEEKSFLFLDTIIEVIATNNCSFYAYLESIYGYYIPIICLFCVRFAPFYADFESLLCL